MGENAVWFVLLSRSRSREEEVRPAWMEHTLRVQRIRFTNQHAAVAGRHALALERFFLFDHSFMTSESVILNTEMPCLSNSILMVSLNVTSFLDSYDSWNAR